MSNNNPSIHKGHLPCPLKRQIGGDHYKNLAIQPVEYIHQNNLNFLAGCIIKRIARFNRPGGKGSEDLNKISHELDLLIDQYKKGFFGHDLFPTVHPLTIGPVTFCNANGFGAEQRTMITLITIYNRGGGIESLYEAKILIRDLIAAFIHANSNAMAVQS